MPRTVHLNNLVAEIEKLLGHSTGKSVPTAQAVTDDVLRSGEVPEVVIARAKGLDLSPAATRDRAHQQGYRTDAYHGTIHTEPELSTDGVNPLIARLMDMETEGKEFSQIRSPSIEDTGRLSTLVGPHFAQDHRISDTFASKNRMDMDEDARPRLLPVRLRGGIYDVPQPQGFYDPEIYGSGFSKKYKGSYVPGELLEDDMAVGHDIIRHYLESNPTHLEEFIEHNPKYRKSADKSYDIAERLLQYQPVPEIGVTGHGGISDALFHTGERDFKGVMGDDHTRGALDLYRDTRFREGNPILRYQNTFEGETRHAKDKSSLIQTDPAGIRSKFAVFDPDYQELPGLGYKDGGPVKKDSSHLDVLRAEIESMDLPGDTGPLRVDPRVEKQVKRIRRMADRDPDSSGPGFAVSNFASQIGSMGDRSISDVIAGRPAKMGVHFDRMPGAYHDLVALPSALPRWIYKPTKDVEHSKEISEANHKAVSDELGLPTEPRNTRETLGSAAGLMLGSIPFPSGAISNSLKSLGVVIPKAMPATGALGMLGRSGAATSEFLVPVVHPKASHYMVGTGAGGVLGDVVNESLDPNYKSDIIP